MCVRNAEDIEKMLAHHIVNQIYNQSIPSSHWMQIGPFPTEMRNTLNPIFEDSSQFVNGVVIMGELNKLLLFFFDNDMKTLIGLVDPIDGKEKDIATPIIINELISLVVIAIKHQIPIKDFINGLEINWNVDNPSLEKKTN